jgi:two-component system, NarL family, sensor histidine kinase EvgS
LILVSSNNKNDTINILVVDDQPITRELLARAIGTQGYSVDSAGGGEEAFSLWLKKKHSIVITDCHMPIKNGFQLCKDIRNTEKLNGLSHTLVIAWTANAREEEQENCFDAGIDGFLDKPINFNQLKQLLAKLNSPVNAPFGIENHNNQTEISDSNIDFSILSQIANDEKSQHKVIQDLLSHIKHGYQSLEQYLVAQNLKASQDLAHRLKGACMMVGANKVAKAFDAIEHLNSFTYSNDYHRLLHFLNQAITQLEESTSFEAKPVFVGD